MATMRELKGRISSVHSSQKITGAMKMISSARLRRAESAMNHVMPYWVGLQAMQQHVSVAGCDYVSPLTVEREVQRVAIVICASDEGLCGAFNITLYKKLLEAVRDYQGKGASPASVYLIGKKLNAEVSRMAGIQKMDMSPLFLQKDYTGGINVLSEELVDRFQRGDIDRVEVIYSHYKSMGTQIVMRQQLLPIIIQPESKPVDAPETGLNRVYIFEPDGRTILDALYPLLFRTTLYKALLENQTSEQAARILSMQMANDNANKLLGNLKLEYNKLRQQGITAELLDIMGGASPS